MHDCLCGCATYARYLPQYHAGISIAVPNNTRCLPISSQATPVTPACRRISAAVMEHSSSLHGQGEAGDHHPALHRLFLRAPLTAGWRTKTSNHTLNAYLVPFSVLYSYIISLDYLLLCMYVWFLSCSGAGSDCAGSGASGLTRESHSRWPGWRTMDHRRFKVPPPPPSMFLLLLSLLFKVLLFFFFSLYV